MKMKYFVRSAIAAGTLLAVAPQAMPATATGDLTINATVPTYAVLALSSNTATIAALDASPTNVDTIYAGITLTLDTNGPTTNRVTIEQSAADALGGPGLLNCVAATPCAGSTIAYQLTAEAAGAATAAAGVTVPANAAPVNYHTNGGTSYVATAMPVNISVLALDARGKAAGAYTEIVTFTLEAL